jgi:hypothetical protein
MEDGPNDAEITRPPVITDLVELCRLLNEHGANYIVLGGMAINIHGYTRNTEDIDLLIETGIPNETKVLSAISLLPEGAAKELRPGEIGDYVVIRVCDEITVDLMARACGHDYAAACHLVSSIEIDGVRIPFASPVLLWKTKQTHREKDELDLVFLRKLLMDRGEWPVT